MTNVKHVIITGGSSGIGKATAKLYAARGADVSLIARRQDILDGAKVEIDAARQGQGSTHIYSVDVSNKKELTKALDTAVKTSGAPDILMTSAGIAVPGYFEDISADNFERHMSVNYFGTVYALQAVLPAMRKRGSGRVVLVSSGAGLIGIFGYCAYSPTKFALRGLAESLRGELKRDGVGVSIVYPPDTDTPQLHEENKTKPAETKAMTGTAKMWSSDDVANTIVKGIDRGKFSITPGWEMTWLARLGSLINPIVNWEFDRLAKKVQKDI